jgi:hypothetical protein
MLLIYDSIIALTQQITALFITFYLLQLPAKARYTWWFTAFFLGITLVTLTIFLEASLLGWGQFFFPVRVIVGLCAQASLIQFACHFPDNDQPRAARGLRWFSLGLILLAVGASIHSIARSYPTPDQSPPFSLLLLMLLLPLGVLKVIGVLWWRALHLHHTAQHQTGQLRRIGPDLLHVLTGATSPHAAALRTFGVVLLFGFIPAGAPLLHAAGYVSASVTAYIVGLGTLLVHLALFLVFLNATRAASSFIARIFS